MDRYLLVKNGIVIDTIVKEQYTQENIYAKTKNLTVEEMGGSVQLSTREGKEPLVLSSDAASELYILLGLLGFFEGYETYKIERKEK